MYMIERAYERKRIPGHGVSILIYTMNKFLRYILPEISY